jgi:hypothetical protein
MLPKDVIFLIQSFLLPHEWRISRTICKRWNEQAPSSHKRRVEALRANLNETDDTYNQNRRNRAKTQSISVISGSLFHNLERIEYQIKGLSDIYTVTLFQNDSVTSCTCKDYIQRMRMCKHQFYLMKQYLKSDNDHPKWDVALKLLK